MFHYQQEAVTEALKKQIDEGFSLHSIAVTGFDERGTPVAFTVYDGERFIGGVIVAIFWGALHIKTLFIEEAYRGQGVGRGLMEHAFQYARESKLPFVFVETMSFQALGFYQKLGFELEFTRPGYAHGTSLHYLRKAIAAADR